MSEATAELGLAMNEIGKEVGLTHIVTVYDAIMHRMLKMANCAGEPLGEPKIIGGVLTYAVIYEIGDELEQRLRVVSGTQSAILPDHSALKLVA